MNIERKLSGKPDDEIGQIKIRELLEPMAKPLTTIYKSEYEHEGLPSPIQIPADEAHKYIHRVDALLETAGVKTADDLFEAQENGRINLNKIFAESMKSVDSSLDAEFRSINDMGRQDFVKISESTREFLGKVERVLTVGKNQTKEDFFEQLKFLDSLAIEVNAEFENRKMTAVNEAIESAKPKIEVQEEKPSVHLPNSNPQVIVLDDVKKQQQGNGKL